MKTLSTIIAAILMATTVAAQTQKKYGFKDFSSINVSGGVEMTITQGTKHEVRAEYNLPEGKELKVGMHGNILSIKVEGNSNSSRGHHYVKFYITMPDITSIESKGALDLHLNKMKTGDMRINSSGAADIEIEELRCNNLRINQNGAADIEGVIHCEHTTSINTNGAGDYSLDINSYALVLNTNGASEVEASFKGRACTIDGNGASDIKLTTECESLTCESRGSSTITVRGTADITKIKSRGASKINTSELNKF